MSSKRGKRRRGAAGTPEATPTEQSPALRAPAARPVTRAPTRVSRRSSAARKEEQRRRYLIAGGIAAVAVAALVLAVFVVPGLLPGSGAPTAAAPTAAACPEASGAAPATLAPPAATPLANPPAEPAGDGTTACIQTELGTIVIELFNRSSPVAAQNFVNLAEAGFYDGVGFHRTIPGFMIQGGDPAGTGGGGPGYTIADEPIVGEYVRGTVAMARTPAPNSQGSQFFIVVDDSPHLEGGGYTIFGRVLSGMEVADAIVSRPTTGAQNDLAVDPVAMTRVTIQRP